MDQVNAGYTCVSTSIFLFTFLTTGVGTFITGKSNCSLILETPLITVALVLMSLSLAVTVSSCISWQPCQACSACLLLLILPLSGTYTIMSFNQAGITHKGKGLELPDRAYDEFRLHAYSKRLQSLVTNSKNWNNVHRCLIKTDACKRFSRDKVNNTFMEFSTKELSPIESGCCKPSYFCNFTYVRPTNWTVGLTSTSNNITDCNAWSNDPGTLCFNCQTCKAGVLEVFKNKWTDVFKLNF